MDSGTAKAQTERRDTTVRRVLERYMVRWMMDVTEWVDIDKSEIVKGIEFYRRDLCLYTAAMGFKEEKGD